MSIVTCLCGQRNRVPELAPGQAARCGKCRARIAARQAPLEDAAGDEECSLCGGPHDLDDCPEMDAE